MRHLKSLCIFALILIGSATWCAADGVSLETCFRSALRQSALLAEQQEVVRQAEEHYRQALAAILPGISAGYTYFNQDTANLPAGTDSSLYRDQTTAALSLTQPLFRGFRDFAALKLNRNLIVSQQQAYQWAALQLYQDTAGAFYLVLSLENDIAILQKEADLYDKRINELRSRVAIGRSRPTEVLNVQVSRATLLAQMEQVRSQLAAARELFAFLTGLPPASELFDPQEMPAALGSFESYNARLSDRPDIKAALARTAAAENGLDIAKGAYLPSADLAGDYFFNRPKGTLQDSKWDAQIDITLPVFTGGLNTSRHAEAESLLRQSRSDLEQVRRLAQRDLRTIYQQLTYDLSQVKQFQDAADLAEKNYLAVAGDYDLGLVSNLEVLQVMTNYQDVERSLNKARYNYKADLNGLWAITAAVNIPDRTAAP
ncbi:MAG TPA: TolC family protein [Candidatus Sulfotelmatobacter sp.]|nr:TolC family protein [Candidatus Sulfotelmatobacter sp.]